MSFFILISKQKLFYGDSLIRTKIFNQNRDRHFFCHDHLHHNHCHKFVPKFNIDRVLKIKKAFLFNKNRGSKHFDRFEKVKKYKKNKNSFHKKVKVEEIKSKKNRFKSKFDLEQKNFDKSSFIDDNFKFKLNEKNDNANRVGHSDFEQINLPFSEQSIKDTSSNSSESNERLRKTSKQSFCRKISFESISLQSKKSSLDISKNDDIITQFEIFSEHHLSIFDSIPSLEINSEYSNASKKLSTDTIVSGKQINENFLVQETTKQSTKNSVKNPIEIAEIDSLSFVSADKEINDDFELNEDLKKKSIFSHGKETNVSSDDLKNSDKNNENMDKQNLILDFDLNEKNKKKDEISKIDQENNSTKFEFRKSKASFLKTSLPEAIVKDPKVNLEKKKKSIGKMIKRLSLSSEQAQNITNDISKKKSLSKLKNFENQKENTKKNDQIELDENSIITCKKIKEEEKYNGKNSNNLKNLVEETKSIEDTLKKEINNSYPKESIGTNKNLDDENLKTQNDRNSIKPENKIKNLILSEKQETKIFNRFMPKNFSLNFDLNITRAFTFSYFSLPKQQDDLNKKILIFKQNYDLIKRFVKNEKTKKSMSNLNNFLTNEQQIKFFEEFFKKLSPFRNKTSPIKVETQTIKLLNLMLEDILKKIELLDESFQYGQFCQTENFIT